MSDLIGRVYKFQKRQLVLQEHPVAFLKVGQRITLSYGRGCSDRNGSAVVVEHDGRTIMLDRDLWPAIPTAAVGDFVYAAARVLADVLSVFAAETRLDLDLFHQLHHVPDRQCCGHPMRPHPKLDVWCCQGGQHWISGPAFSAAEPHRGAFDAIDRSVHLPQHPDEYHQFSEGIVADLAKRVLAKENERLLDPTEAMMRRKYEQVCTMVSSADVDRVEVSHETTGERVRADHAAFRQAYGDARQQVKQPPDPMLVEYDGVTLRALLDGDAFNRQERGNGYWQAKRMTDVQRAAVSAHWSAELRDKVAAKDAADKDRERRQVVLDTADVEDTPWGPR